jgi:hypothetical protein
MRAAQAVVLWGGHRIAVVSTKDTVREFFPYRMELKGPPFAALLKAVVLMGRVGLRPAHVCEALSEVDEFRQLIRSDMGLPDNPRPQAATRSSAGRLEKGPGFGKLDYRSKRVREG